MMLFEDISHAVKNQNIHWKKHALIRMFERNISREEVKYAILNGEIIEQYPNDYPFPSILIANIENSRKALHIVLAYSNNYCYIITAYEPDEKIFGRSLKQRRTHENK